jgi:type IV secretory pathway VirB10-like protein
MKRKVRKFQEGGFSAEQEEWLGGADRTDPYILARMRKAVPDRPMAKASEVDTGELRDETGMVSKIKRNTETGDLYSTEAPTPRIVEKTTTTVKTAPKPTPKTTAVPQDQKDRMAELEKKQALINVSPEDYIPGVGMVKGVLKKGLTRLMKPRMKTYSPAEFEAMTPKLGRENLKLGMKKGGSVKKMASGGKVSSASKRADGCAVKGKTRGRIV